MKTSIILIISAILLSGCSFSLNGWQVLKAVELCKDHNGVDNINVFFVETVTCRNGKIFRITHD